MVSMANSCPMSKLEPLICVPTWSAISDRVDILQSHLSKSNSTSQYITQKMTIISALLSKVHFCKINQFK